MPAPTDVSAQPAPVTLAQLDLGSTRNTNGDVEPMSFVQMSLEQKNQSQMINPIGFSSIVNQVSVFFATPNCLPIFVVRLVGFVFIQMVDTRTRLCMVTSQILEQSGSIQLLWQIFCPWLMSHLYATLLWTRMSQMLFSYIARTD